MESLPVRAITVVAVPYGCHVFGGNQEGAIELAGRTVFALAEDEDGTCLAVVDGHEIWRRCSDARWLKVATASIPLQSLMAVGGVVFGGGAEEATMVRVGTDGSVERLASFDRVAGRNEWFAGGPPLGVRSLTRNADGSVMLAGVHVGGVPRSEDGGASWMPTIPVLFDVHEVRAHASDPGVMAAATAVGLCLSQDGGRNWEVEADGLEVTNSLAVAALEDEFLFGVSDGPFAKKSQLWRWGVGQRSVERVSDGLPEWLEGKIDTGQIAGGCGCAALIDGGGTLWRSRNGSRDWSAIASGLPYPSNVLLLKNY